MREHLLLVLPTGNKYDYRCTVCHDSIGDREETGPSPLVAPEAEAKGKRGKRGRR